MVSHREPDGWPRRGGAPWLATTLAATLAAALALTLAATLAGCAASAPSQRAHGAAGTPARAASASATATEQARTALQQATRQVIGAERAFAATMANRNFKAFLTYLSPDAIFFSGSSVQRGPGQIAEQWAPYFQGRRAPFAWQPDDVQVLADGKLALSTGPLLQSGHIVGRFNSVWRLEAPNTWHIILDKGEAVCSAPPPTTNSNGEQFFDNPSGGR